MAFAPALAPLLGGLGGAGAAASGGLSLGTVLSGIGTAVGVFGQISANNARAAMARENARRAADNAVRTQQTSQIEQQAKDAETAAMLGELEAQQSASGLSTLSGSSSLVRRRARVLGRQDAMNLRRRGDVESQNYLNQAADFKAEAADAKRNNLFTFLSGATKIGSTLLGGASSTSSTYDPWKGMRRVTY